MEDAHLLPNHLRLEVTLTVLLIIHWRELVLSHHLEACGSAGKWHRCRDRPFPARTVSRKGAQVLGQQLLSLPLGILCKTMLIESGKRNNLGCWILAWLPACLEEKKREREESQSVGSQRGENLSNFRMACFIVSWGKWKQAGLAATLGELALGDQAKIEKIHLKIQC